MADEMAQWVKALDIKPENLSLIPGTHMMNSYKVSCDLHMLLWHIFIHIYIQ